MRTKTNDFTCEQMSGLPAKFLDPSARSMARGFSRTCLTATTTDERHDRYTIIPKIRRSRFVVHIGDVQLLLLFTYLLLLWYYRTTMITTMNYYSRCVRVCVCTVRGVNQPIIIIIKIGKNDSGRRVCAKKKKFGVVRRRILEGLLNGGVEIEF